MIDHLTRYLPVEREVLCHTGKGSDKIVKEKDISLWTLAVTIMDMLLDMTRTIYFEAK